MRLPTDQKCCHLVRSSTHRHPKTRNANHPVLFHQRCCWKLSLVRRGFVRITFCLPLVLPTVSLPKFSVVGLAESCPVWGAQVPPRVIGGGGVGALLANDKLPVTLPELDGAKSTVILPEPPAGTSLAAIVLQCPSLHPSCSPLIVVLGRETHNQMMYLRTLRSYCDELWQN